MCASNTIIMFDLENTLIDSWWSENILEQNVDYIKRMIGCDFDLYTYGIFSYAIDFETEKQRGINYVKNIFPEINIDNRFVPCVEELKKDLFGELLNDYNTKNELISILGKEFWFQIWARKFPEYDFILFDDALPHKSIVVERKITPCKTQRIRLERVDAFHKQK